MAQRSATHLVLIPSYNPGARVFETVAAALAHWAPVWVIVDGSDDGTGEALARLAEKDANLRVLSLPRNRGKGAAVLHGVHAALRDGFTHVLTMDSDGQHPAEEIPAFMAASAAAPAAMILGEPVFDANAPLLRCVGGEFQTGGPTSRRSGPEYTTRCLDSACIRPSRWSASCVAKSGCVALTSTSRRS